MKTPRQKSPTSRKGTRAPAKATPPAKTAPPGQAQRTQLLIVGAACVALILAVVLDRSWAADLLAIWLNHARQVPR